MDRNSLLGYFMALMAVIIITQLGTYEAMPTNSTEATEATKKAWDTLKTTAFLANAARVYSASMKMVEQLTKENKISFIKNKEAFENMTCKLRPVSRYLSAEIKATVKDVKLLEYHLQIANYTKENNPLLTNLTYMYKGNLWNRISHSHGQTILNLAFNYGILSLMTLSFGVAEREVEVYEEPRGCMAPLDEDTKAQVVLNLLLRDFDPDGPLTVLDGQFICNQVIKDVDGNAKFTDQCCFAQWPDYKVVCTIDLNNKYLKIMDILIAIVSILVFLFGPLAFTGMFYTRTLDMVKYVVKLKESFYKTMVVCRGDSKTNKDIIADYTLDLTNRKLFPKAKKLAKVLPSDVVLPIKISEFNIQINYMKLLPENEVPVGVLKSIPRALFFCKLNEIDACADCCEANALGCMREKHPIPWQDICNLVGKVLLVFCIPTPYYVRLIVYYLFEHPEVVNRHEAVERLNLDVAFEYRILPYLTPTHPVLIGTYIIYFSVGLAMAFSSLINHKNKFETVIIDSLHDLIHTSWISALEMVVKNFLWPFQKLGIFGCIVGPIYWAFVMPLCLIVIVFYCIPLIFFSCRLLTHSMGITTKDDRSKEQALPGEMKRMPTGMQIMEADQLVNTFHEKGWKRSQIGRRMAKKSIPQIIINLCLAVICICTLCSLMAMLSVVVTFLLQIIIFTMMGIIVNAGKVLKYGTLIFLVVLYSYDCYNNVYQQYLKLNKTLFNEIKGRIKEIMEFTSLPSHLQENRGFKSQEASEQADYEETDNISKQNHYNWDINDLILFIDNDDVPRIPKKLFEEVCEIKVPGSPGPVYLSLMAATGKFMFIVVFLVFVFIVVMSFGDVYKLSSTNQMLATMAGGFMPMIFSNILKPKTPPIELGSVSFKGKLEEVMINFWQTWPMYDLPFDLEEKPEEEEDDDSDAGSNKSGGGKDKKDKKDDKKDDKSSINSDEEEDEDEELTKEKVKTMLQGMKSVRPADGQYVDIAIIVPEDEEMREWASLLELSAHSNPSLLIAKPPSKAPSLNIPLQNNNDPEREVLIEGGKIVQNGGASALMPKKTINETYT